MTPYLTRLAIEALTDARVDEMQALAWQTANLMRARKLPSLKSLLAKKRPAASKRGKEMSLKAYMGTLAKKAGDLKSG